MKIVKTANRLPLIRESVVFANADNHPRYMNKNKINSEFVSMWKISHYVSVVFVTETSPNGNIYSREFTYESLAFLFLVTSPHNYV